MGDSDKELRELIEIASIQSFILLGDFNHHIDWIQQEGKRQRDSIFLDFINDKFLFRRVEESTRGNYPRLNYWRAGWPYGLRSRMQS